MRSVERVRYTMDLISSLVTSSAPKLLIWDEEETSQAVEYAERFVNEMPATIFFSWSLFLGVSIGRKSDDRLAREIFGLGHPIPRYY